MKIEEDYNALYGDIPTSSEERIKLLYKECKFPKKIKKEVQRRIRDIEKIGWEDVTYTMYILPKATPRPRSTSKGNFFYVKGAADNKKYFKKRIMQEDWNIIMTPCFFICKSYFPIPKNMSKVDKILAEMGYVNDLSMPDFDNLAKTYSDMIKGILLFDDRLIIKGVSEKYYSTKPRVEVSISYMKEFDSGYNKRKIERCV